VQAEQRAAQLLSLNSRLREDTEKMLSDQQQQQQQQQQQVQRPESPSKTEARSRPAASTAASHSPSRPGPMPKSAADPKLAANVAGGDRGGDRGTAGASTAEEQVVVPAGVSAGTELDVRLTDGSVARVRVPAGAAAGSTLEVGGERGEGEGKGI
jgi:exonuclease VII large subunit